MPIVKHIIPAVLAFILAFPSHLAVANPIPGVPETDDDLIRIRDAANKVVAQSIPACLLAVCVNGECNAAKAVDTALAESAAAVAKLESPLWDVREIYTDHVEALLGEAGIAQDQAQRYRDAQSVQDSLQVIAHMAEAIANWRGFAQDLGNKAWESEPAQRFIASILDRIKDLIEYTRIGDASDGTGADEALVKLFAEMALEIDKYRNAQATTGLTRQTRGELGLAMVKKVGDFAIELDRIERRKRLVEQEAFSDLALAGTKEPLESARRISERIAVVRQTLAAVNRARLGLANCSVHLCGSAKAHVEPVVAGSSVPPNADSVTRQRLLRRFNQDIDQAGAALATAVQEFEFEPDTQTTIGVDRDAYENRSVVNGTYDIAPICVPDDARLAVLLASEQDEDGDTPIMDLGPVSGKGKSGFRVFDHLQNTWQGPRGKEIKIWVEGQTVRIIVDDTPVAGRDREYVGRLDEVPSVPGNYTFALTSADRKDVFVSVPFEIFGDTPDGEQAVVESTPRVIEDLSPRLPFEVRTQLLNRPPGQAFSYRIKFRPPHHNDRGERKIEAEFWTYSMRWNRLTKIIDPESIKEKLSRSVTLTLPDN